MSEHQGLSSQETEGMGSLPGLQTEPDLTAGVGAEPEDGASSCASVASPALAVEGVGVDLGGRRVVRDAHLAVYRGELVGLIGPNGAGKTTLLRTILGLLTPATGRVLVDGRRTKPGRSSIGYVPQRHDFAWEYPISVAETVMTGLAGALRLLRRPKKEHWDAVMEGLRLVRMESFARRPVGQLSGGQRQRVLVARALALRPGLLLLDEPFTGLDMPTQELLADLFATLAHEGRAVLMTTHDLASALYSCDRLALLNRTVVADATPAELVDTPEAWMSTFGVGPDSPLLRILKA